MNKIAKTLCIVLGVFNQHVTAGEEMSAEVAQVLGKTIYANDFTFEPHQVAFYKRSDPEMSDAEIVEKIKSDKLTSLIWARIFQNIEKKQSLEPTQDELKSFAKAMGEQSAGALDNSVAPEQIEAALEVNKYFVKTYKVSKYLYETYGGEVIFQQGNPQEPVGAYRKLLEEYEAQGNLKIFDQKYKTAFWAYFLREHPGVIPKEKVDFSKPWWEKDK